MSWYRAVGISTLALVAQLAVGCGPNCQSTCNRLYVEEECNIQRPGYEGEKVGELIQQCMDLCEGALEVPGELEGYNPDDRVGSSDSIDLENEKQAAVWMDCIAETSCEDLNQGYCAPIW